MTESTFQKWASRILTKYGYIRVKYPAPAGSVSLTFTDRDLVRTAILNTLGAAFSSKKPCEREFLADLSHRILGSLEKNRSMSLQEQLNELHDGIVAERMLSYALVCGVACNWEMEVKILAEKLGVSVFSEGSFKNRKSPGFRQMSEIIGDIKTKLPNVDLQLARSREIRDSLVHGNFHQLKTAASENQKRPRRDSFRSRILRVKSGESEVGAVVDMNEIKELEKIRREGVFAWFLAAATSSLFESVALELKERTLDISSFISLRALSFGETSWVFDRVAIEGRALTETERQMFLSSRSESFGSKQSLELLLSRVQRCIK